MGLAKIYFVGGLLLLGGAAVWPDESLTDLLAYAGLLALCLGLLQIYVTLPLPAKRLSAAAYLLGVVLLALGGKWPERGGRALVLLVLAAHTVGVLRFPGKAKTN